MDPRTPTGARVCIYTANMGRYDRPLAQVDQDIDVTWLYCTDSEVEAPAPWLTHEVTPNGETPNLAAKWWKTHPPVGYGYAIWIDSNMQITSRSFAREAIEFVHDGIAVWAHPRRSTIRDEAIATVGAERQQLADGSEKYDCVRVAEQVEHYYADGFPDNLGLFACGTIVWTPERPLLFGSDWLHECAEWTPQDQLSFPYVCWRHDVRPGVFPVPQIERAYSRARRGQLGNRWLQIRPHGG